jgi:hypothetical protein
LEKQYTWTSKCAALFKVPDEPPEDNGVKYPDLIDELSILQWAGLCVEKVENVGNVKHFYSSKNCFLCRFY